MKKTIFLLVFVFSVININSVSFADEYPNSIVELKLGSDRVIYNINDKEYSKRYHDIPIFADEYGRIQIPLEYVQNVVAEPSNEPVWDKESKTITLRRATTWDTILQAQIGSNVLKTYNNGVETDVEMDCLPIIKEGRAFIPLRYVLNAIGIGDESIAWDESLETVRITKNIIYYSDEEMDRMHLLLHNNWDELHEKCGMNGFSTSNIYNMVAVYAPEWSEEAKEYMMNFLGTDNIRFGIDDGTGIDD